MKWLFPSACALVLGIGPAAAQRGPSDPPKPHPVTELKGTIEKIEFSPGQGTPLLIVRTDDGKMNVVLGSMRYLLEQNFRPKAGEEVVVRGFRFEDEIIAVTVALGSGKRVLRLRDEEGRPVWVRGRPGGRAGRGGGPQ